MSMRLICIGCKTEFGYCHMMTGVCCDDFVFCYSDNGKEEGAKCTSRTIKPECSDCGLSNPNSHPNRLHI